MRLYLGQEKERSFQKQNSEVYEYENANSFNSSKEINKTRNPQNKANDREANNKPSDKHYKNQSYSNKNFPNEKEDLGYNEFDYNQEKNQNKNESAGIEFEKNYYENFHTHPDKNFRQNSYKTDSYIKSTNNTDKFNNESNYNYRNNNTNINKNLNQNSYNYSQKTESFSNKGKNYDANQKNHYTNSRGTEEKSHKNYLTNKNNEFNNRYQGSRQEYYEIRETSLNEESKPQNFKRNDNKNYDDSITEENRYSNKDNYQKNKKGYFKNQNNFKEENQDVYANKNYENRGSNKNKYQNGDYFDVAFSMDKSKNQNNNLANNYKKCLEKQYDETNINKLFEQAASNTETIASVDKLEKNAENLKKETQATEEKAVEKTIKSDADLNKTVEKIDVKRPSYQMEVEKISLSITNVNLNENEQFYRKDKNEPKNDLRNEENGISSETKKSFREENFSEKLENGTNTFEVPNGNNNNDNQKDCETQNPEKEKSTDYDFFKQIPNNSFINAINYNNYFFGNSNPRDMKKEDFEKSNLQNNFGFGMNINIPHAFHRIPQPNYKPFSTPSATPFITMPFYPGNPEYPNQNHYPHQMIGLYPSQYMIPYPFMEGYMPMPSYQNSYPYLNQNGQLLYSSNVNNVTNSGSKPNGSETVNPDVQK